MVVCEWCFVVVAFFLLAFAMLGYLLLFIGVLKGDFERGRFFEPGFKIVLTGLIGLAVLFLVLLGVAVLCW